MAFYPDDMSAIACDPCGTERGWSAPSSFEGSNRPEGWKWSYWFNRESSLKNGLYCMFCNEVIEK